VDDFPTGQVHDHEAVQDLEPQGDDGEKVARPGLMEMVADKGGPGLATVARQVRRSILGDGPRRDLVAKLAKLPGDSVLTPERIFLPIPANHGPQVSIGWRSTNRPSGLSPPEQSPKGTMPADDGFGAHDGDRLEHRAEEASGESEHDAISRTDAGLWHRTTQDDDLLAKDGIFGEEGGAGLEGRTQRARTVLKISMNIAARDLARGDHPRNPGTPKTAAGSTWYRIFAAHSCDFKFLAESARSDWYGMRAGLGREWLWGTAWPTRCQQGWC
jgi:hypothetical protein